MRRYNFMRPILIIAVAFLVNNMVSSISMLLGASEEAAGNYAFVAMMVAVIITFMRLNRRKPDKQD